jgi:hypothetical protein
VSDLRDKLKDAKSQDTASSGSWLYSSRIAKPLRGGVVSPGEAETVSNPQVERLASAESATSKRSSWYVSLLKK